MRLRKLFAFSAAGLAIAGLFFLYGFLTAEHRLFPYGLIASSEGKLARLHEIVRGRPPVREVLSTSLMRLNLLKIHVPANKDITNGSLTAVGNDMLLMSGSGEVFFYAAGAEDVVRTDLDLPANHLEEMIAAEREPKYAGYVQDLFTNLRYMHLLHVEDGPQHLLFVSFTEWHPEDECYTNTLARLDMTSQGVDASKWRAKSGDWEVIFRTKPCLPLKKIMRAVEAHISAGRMVFDPAKRELILTIGDFHWDGVHNDVMLAQDDANDYGKAIALGLDGKGARHIAKGLRNAQGITYDRNGQLWFTDHGPNGGDELNVLQQGGNYGWPLATLGKGYNGLPWKPARQFGRHDDFLQPIYSWIPSVGLSSILQVHGFDNAWEDDLLISSMGGNAVYRVRIVEGRVQFAEPIGLGERIRFLLQPEPGVIALWTDSRHLIIMTPASADDTGDYVERFISEQEWTDARKETVRTTLSSCTQCHAYRPDPGRGAPHLVGSFNRSVASTEFRNYSEALKTIGGRWNEQRLQSFLIDSQSVAPGSSMPSLRLSVPTAQDVVQVLKALDRAQ